MILFRKATIILLAVVGVVAAQPLKDANPNKDDSNVPLVKHNKQIQLPPKTTIIFPDDLRRRYLRVSSERLLKDDGDGGGEGDVSISGDSDSDSLDGNNDVVPTGDGGQNRSLSNVVLDIIMDDYPQEVGWLITDWNGVVWGGRSAGYYSRRRYNYFEFLNLPSGMYTLTMTDTAGDGLCCGYGMGSFVLSVHDYPVLFGGNYEASFSDDFFVDY